ncbi:hypothetical protein E2C01_005200 [Portunus trituberculatus]|uniref:Uncharacterized protein n=1 Tax=Portunus trituberculatus TaxID=210409 RepID=A0A5B7CUI7_PORTR|nr:hypothetical protein [Portunus trituberculatus]
MPVLVPRCSRLPPGCRTVPRIKADSRHFTRNKTNLDGVVHPRKKLMKVMPPERGGVQVFPCVPAAAAAATATATGWSLST